MQQAEIFPSACPLTRNLSRALGHSRKANVLLLHHTHLHSRQERCSQAANGNRLSVHARTGLRAVDSAPAVDQSTTRQILAGLEGDQEEQLRISEAFWKVGPDLELPESVLPLTASHGQHVFGGCRALDDSDSGMSNLSQLAHDSVNCSGQAMKEQPARRGPNVVRVRHRRTPAKVDMDVCVCGGTLGIFIATALQVTTTC